MIQVRAPRNITNLFWGLNNLQSRMLSRIGISDTPIFVCTLQFLVAHFEYAIYFEYQIYRISSDRITNNNGWKCCVHLFLKVGRLKTWRFFWNALNAQWIMANMQDGPAREGSRQSQGRKKFLIKWDMSYILFNYMTMMACFILIKRR